MPVVTPAKRKAQSTIVQMLFPGKGEGNKSAVGETSSFTNNRGLLTVHSSSQQLRPGCRFCASLLCFAELTR